MQLSQLRKVVRHKTFIKTKTFLVPNQLSLNIFDLQMSNLRFIVKFCQ